MHSWFHVHTSSRQVTDCFLSFWHVSVQHTTIEGTWHFVELTAKVIATYYWWVHAVGAYVYATCSMLSTITIFRVLHNGFLLVCSNLSAPFAATVPQTKWRHYLLSECIGIHAASYNKAVKGCSTTVFTQKKPTSSIWNITTTLCVLLCAVLNGKPIVWETLQRAESCTCNVEWLWH